MKIYDYMFAQNWKEQFVSDIHPRYPRSMAFACRNEGFAPWFRSHGPFVYIGAENAVAHGLYLAWVRRSENFMRLNLEE